jgi:hypothetical protein
MKGKDHMVDIGVDGRIILWRMDPFLVKDIETNETTTVAMQRRGKQRLYNSIVTVGNDVM